MKVLIVLLAVVATCFADDDCPAPGSIRDCIVAKVSDVEKKNLASLQKIHACVVSSFNLTALIKAFPQFQLPQGQVLPQGPRPAIPPALQGALADFVPCHNALNNSFHDCVSAAGINLPPFPHDQQRGPQLAFGGAGGPGRLGAPSGPAALFMDKDGQFNFDAIKEKASSVSASDTAKFLACAFKAVAQDDNIVPAFVSLIRPGSCVCPAVKGCLPSISDACKAKFESHRAAVCNCVSQSVVLFKSNDQCEKARAAIQANAQAANAAVPAGPQHPHFVCNSENHQKNPCESESSNADALIKSLNDKIKAFKDKQPSAAGGK